MTATKSTRPTVEEILADLDAQRNNPELQRQRRADLESRVRAHEVKYGMTASQAHEAIDRREFRETLEVCDWFMDDNVLKRVRAREAGR